MSVITSGLGFCLALFGLLPVLLSLRLHDVIHQVVNILIVHLLVSIVKLLLIYGSLSTSCRVKLFPVPCPLVFASFRHGSRLIVLTIAVPSLALALAVLLSLMI